MSEDLSDFLSSWPYEPGKLNVRIVRATDGRPVVQVRLDLGILQMELDGRPDGLRPEGFESLLDLYEDREEEWDAGLLDPDGTERELADAKPPEGEFTLSPDDCRALRDEAMQYSHRYVALLAAEDYERVVRDTTRNLRLFDFCAKHAETEADRTVLEQFRPYVTMVRARALASQALKDNEPKAAILAIDDGLNALRQHFANAGHTEAYNASNEVRMLQSMRDALVPKLPVSQKSELRRRLDRALAQENYELAAILRDELKQLPE